MARPRKELRKPPLAGTQDASLAAAQPFASRYIWWKPPAEAVAQPQRVIAQVMNMGDQRDIEALAKLVGDDVLRETLLRAEAGQFGERAWTYWHYRLDLADVAQVPPLPGRRFS